MDLVTHRGTLRTASPDALPAVVGECNALNRSTERPDLRQDVHFCPDDDLWGWPLYTSEAADERSTVDLGVRRTIQQNNTHT